MTSPRLGAECSGGVTLVQNGDSPSLAKKGSAKDGCLPSGFRNANNSSSKMESHGVSSSVDAGADTVSADLRISTTRGQPSGSLLPTSHRNTDSSDARALKVNNTDDSTINVAVNVDDGVSDDNDAYNAISGGLSSDLQGGVKPSSNQVRSDNRVRHKTSVPDLGDGNFSPIRSVSGTAREILGLSRGDARTGMPSWVARVSRAVKDATADAITDAVVNTDARDAVDVTNIAVNADSGDRSISDSVGRVLGKCSGVTEAFSAKASLWVGKLGVPVLPAVPNLVLLWFSPLLLEWMG